MIVVRTPSHETGQDETGARRGDAEGDLQVGGQIADRAEQCEPDQKADRGRDGEGRVAEQPQREDRVAREPRGQQPRGAGAGGHRRQRRNHPGGPLIRPSDRFGEQDERDDGGRPAERAGVVDGRCGPADGKVHRAEHHNQGHHAEWRVDGEDPPPTQVIDEGAADDRATDGRDHVHRAEQPEIAAPFARAHDLADDGLRSDHQPAAAGPLDHPVDEELGNRLREPAQHGADHEYADPGDEQRPAAEPVAQLAVQRHDDGCGDEVCGDHRRHLFQTPELPGNGRQRRSHDRLIEGAEEHHQHQPGKDLPDDRAGDRCAGSRGRRPLCHVRSLRRNSL